MIQKIDSPALIKAAGTRDKRIEEFFGRVNSGTAEVSLARMVSPAGWEEPGQTPGFNEYTLVLKGRLSVMTRETEYVVHTGEAILVGKGEWVKYSTPFEEGAEYIAVCLPAFSPETVHRDE